MGEGGSHRGIERGFLASFQIFGFFIRLVMGDEGGWGVPRLLGPCSMGLHSYHYHNIPEP
jgi:hypothetical protein